MTIAAWVAFGFDQVGRLDEAELGIRLIADAGLYAVIVTLLSLSAGAHLLTRLGHLYRARDHERVPRAMIDDHFADTMPSLTVLVPSYREDARVVRQTLLSAALQEYAPLRVVLLVDDPPNPSDPDHLRLLLEARELPKQIEALLSGPRQRFDAELTAFEARAAVTEVTLVDMLHLADLYREASAWLTGLGKAQERVDHSDDFLVDAVLGKLAEDFAQVAEALRAAVADGARLSSRRMIQLHRRLATTFRAELTSFERKSYASLSHELNKAMNLNSYLGLMGGRYQVRQTPSGPVLLDVAPGEPADLDIPDTDYVLTLDADSTLLPEYCLRLVYLLEQPENARIAVAQTPYSSYPGAATRIERIAGATTDLQHLVHQGLTRHGATFWVGANAVLRKRALDDIVEVEDRGGFRVHRYIQDRTVIEDTESSIDICAHGWELYNYPERLSYSATPPDFGSLCTQRQRWANGGLIILPKLARLLRIRRRSHGRRLPVVEGFLRANYLASICWASVGLIVLLAYPFNSRLLSPWAPLTALPYFVAMSTDLRRCGYRRFDALRVYGINLLLLPVNVSGVTKSLGQAIGGQKIAFARTPKVRNRTVAPMSFVLVPYGIVGLSLYTVWRDLTHGHQAHAAFAAVNAALAAYAIVAFVGLRNSVVDVWMNVLQRLYKPAKADPSAQPAAPDWVTVLYHGATEAGEAVLHGPRAAALALADQRSPADAAAAQPAQPVRPPAGAPVTTGPWAHTAPDASTPVAMRPASVALQRLPRPDSHPHRPAREADEVAADLDAGVDLMAQAIGGYLRRLHASGRVVMRFDGNAMELRVDDGAERAA